MLQNKLIVVTGCPRSGTGYMAKYFDTFNLLVGHEKLRKNGISSWYIGLKDRFEAYRNKGLHKGYGDLYDATIFHITRHPLRMISSMLPRWESVISHRRPIKDIEPDDSPIILISKFWYWWNLMIEENYPSRLQIQVEKAPEEIDRICAILGVCPTERNRITVKTLSTNINTAYHKKRGLSKDKSYVEVYTWWRLWKEVPYGVYKNVRSLSKRYGYKG